MSTEDGLMAENAALRAALRHLEVVIEDAISVGEMHGEDFRLLPWAALKEVSGRYETLLTRDGRSVPA